MRRILLASLLLFALPLQAQRTLGDGIKDLATQITSSAAKQEKQRIAVLPFHELDGPPTVLGTYLAEELVTNLFQLGNFKIVERQLLDKVMGELKIEQSGAIDPKTAKEIGRIAAVDAIVTGSLTDLEGYVAVNCRLIDTTTGEVFGAAQTKISKDEDVNKIMRTALAPGGANSSGTNTSYQAAKAIATKDIGSLRIALKSVLPMKVNNQAGQSMNAIRLTFEFMNRDARQPLFVSLNAEAQSQNTPPILRATVLDDGGGVWKLSSQDLGGLGFVRAGVHGRYGQEMYGTSEIARLLRLRDELGRDADDPADGVTGIALGNYQGTPPTAFFQNKGNRFISGSTTTIEPGQAVTVTMDFHQEPGMNSGTVREFFQFNSEIVVGMGELRTKRSYTLGNVTFDRVGMPPL
jgi:curli biogenesis system outer membrane secretion channel CsgG